MLWYFGKTKELPYLSKWQGEEGVATELDRALSILVDQEDEIQTPEAQYAREFLSRLPRKPDSFDNRYIRRAMCRLSSGLEAQAESIPADWMDCNE